MRNAAHWRLWFPLAASFVVYLTPLAGPHAVWLLGETLLSGLTRGGSGRSGAWVATEVAVALAAQAIVAALLAWCVRGRGLRLLLLVPAFPIMMAGLEYLYLVAIPTRFLIEGETTPERLDLVERCVVPDASLLSVRTPVSLPAQRFREWWAQRSDGRYVTVSIPGCESTTPKLPQPTVQPGGHADFLLAPIYAVRSATLFERTDIAAGTRSWWRLSEGGARFDRLPTPESQIDAPVLSNDGTALAWIETLPARDGPAGHRLHVRSVTSARSETTISMAGLPPASYVIVEYDRVAGEIGLWTDGRLATIDRSGRVVRQSAPVAAIRPQAGTYLRSGDGWLAWDAYRDADPYWLAWSTAGGAGRRRVPLGRSVTSAAVDDSGRFIAVSTTTTVSVGAVRDAVYVFDARDGSEVFRRYLPTYTRSTVAFFDGGWFAYSDSAGTHLLRMPR